MSTEYHSFNWPNQRVSEMKGDKPQSSAFLNALRRLNANTTTQPPRKVQQSGPENPAAFERQLSRLQGTIDELERQRIIEMADRPGQAASETEIVRALLHEPQEALYELNPTPINGLPRSQYRLRSGRTVSAEAARELIDHKMVDLLSTNADFAMKTYGFNMAGNPVENAPEMNPATRMQEMMSRQALFNGQAAIMTPRPPERASDDYIDLTPKSR